ncbi:MAG: HlyD family efflux transporter periplasmic adaptor subunit [Hyphomicrobiales bacterium]|nr:HlyD family efflux transporter periplasmic adaptor subunit [Hyphomicrobiales bacterium]
MSEAKPAKSDTAKPVTPDSVALPRLVVQRAASAASAATPFFARLGRLRYVPLAMALVMLGGIIGLYFQPPGLRFVLRTLGLQPGAGTSHPIAVPVDGGATAARPARPAAPRQIVGLGKLIPQGDVITLSPPFGAADARIASIRVAEGDTTPAGAVLATLDNELPMKAALEAARATLRSREASLAQVRDAVRASRDEARAALDRARSAYANATREYERADALLKRGVATAALTDQKRSARDEAAREVDRLTATLSRYETAKPDDQPDVIVARRAVDAAAAEIARAEQDLEKAYIRAPVAGTILTIHVRPGEKPGTKGVLNMGDISQMTAEVEIYQTQIGRISLGDPVEITAEALDSPLTGTVSRIGLEVVRQSVIDPSPAANTDARVVKVDVTLDPASSARARRYTNLQVTARIAVKDPQ